MGQSESEEQEVVVQVGGLLEQEPLTQTPVEQKPLGHWEEQGSEAEQGTQFPLTQVSPTRQSVGVEQVEAGKHVPPSQTYPGPQGGEQGWGRVRR